ncbi:hypothetical protein B5P19_09630 [Clavibacter sepedonicus]|nr:hypothetical protein B5P19_09630 [Clavibacter sepedonicus]OQJ53973.1 hypothetical protein B5P20_07470 [Clavibacter sepedonicus]
MIVGSGLAVNGTAGLAAAEIEPDATEVTAGSRDAAPATSAGSAIAERTRATASRSRGVGIGVGAQQDQGRR